MSKNQPPYLDLFKKLQAAGMALTLEQYFLLLEALSKGFGRENLAEFKQVCRLLWVKPKDSFSEAVFEAEFARYLAQKPVALESPETEFNQSPPASSSAAASPSPSPESPQTSSKTPAETSFQIPTALRGERVQSRCGQLAFSRQNFCLTVRDLPLTERQILQSWRMLRRPMREGFATELDLKATIAQINSQGQYFQPILRPSRVNRVQLLLLIDHDGSMVPFHLMTRQLVETVRTGQFGKSDIYYFRNCPGDYLYLKPNQPDFRVLNEVLPKLHKTHTLVFIVSDAGAARGGYNSERLELTQALFTRLKSKVRTIIWLNPLPKIRWEKTTAAGIAQLINEQMYELTPSGLQGAMRAIKQRL